MGVQQSDTTTLRPVAIVTGASRGIGAAIAKTLAAKGFDLLLSYRSGEEAAKAVQDFCQKQNSAGKVLIKQADVAKEEDCQSLVNFCKDNFGRVDVLVNNAGQTKDGLAMRMSKEQFDSIIDVNLTSAFLLSKMCLALMVKQRSGRIINMTSVAGVYGNAGQANYAASKAGLIGLTKSLAKEVGGRGITVNAVAPGFIETDMTAGLSDEVIKGALERISLKRLGKPEDIAQAVAFLASPDASYITGQVLEVSGGLVL